MLFGFPTAFDFSPGRGVWRADIEAHRARPPWGCVWVVLTWAGKCLEQTHGKLLGGHPGAQEWSWHCVGWRTFPSLPVQQGSFGWFCWWRQMDILAVQFLLSQCCCMFSWVQSHMLRGTWVPTLENSVFLCSSLGDSYNLCYLNL